MIPDQKQLWDKKHGEGEHEDFRNDPSPFARHVVQYVAPGSTLLELGCGVGRDAIFFASNGHNVTATDFSSVIIERDKQEFKDGNVQFDELDMQRPFPFPDAAFDVVYANLSLHYYSDADTRSIVYEITRVLKPGGIFAFACKSTKDFHYGNGEEVEKNVFVSKTGHVRHLFTEDYVRDLVAENYNFEFLKEVEETYSGEKSVMIQCVARKSSDGTST